MATKGTARPSEYAKRRRTPPGRVPLSAASLRTTPSTGPMHGVQAKAKAMPMTGAAQVPRVDGRTSKRRSPVRRVTNPSGPAPSRDHHSPGRAPRSSNSPRRMTTIPLTCDSTSLWVRNLRTRPRPEAAAPRATKTTVNPAMNRPMPRSTGRSGAPPVVAAAVAPSPAGRQLGRRQPGDHGEVARDEREDARGEEGEDPGAEGDQDAERIGGDGGQHERRPAPASSGSYGPAPCRPRPSCSPDRGSPRRGASPGPSAPWRGHPPAGRPRPAAGTSRR